MVLHVYHYSDVVFSFSAIEKFTSNSQDIPQQQNNNIICKTNQQHGANSTVRKRINLLTIWHVYVNISRIFQKHRLLILVHTSYLVCTHMIRFLLFVAPMHYTALAYLSIALEKASAYTCMLW